MKAIPQKGHQRVGVGQFLYLVKQLLTVSANEGGERSGQQRQRFDLVPHLPFDTILSFRGEVAVTDGWGDGDVPIFERRFLGGASNLRGFDYREVGPKDINGEPVGGLTSAFATAEYTFPLVTRVRGAVFYDVGMVSEQSWDFGGDVNSNVGVGLRLYLPVGPINVDFGIPVQADEFNDSDGKIQFNVGYRF